VKVAPSRCAGRIPERKLNTCRIRCVQANLLIQATPQTPGFHD
jgi:hypothetical protein